jgi:hypothetical protein
VKQLIDTMRYIFVSPELASVLVPFAIFTFHPELADVLVKPMKDGIVFGLTATALPLAMLAFNYEKGFDLLSPKGARKVLLEWPGYPMVKGRVIASFVWCVIGIAACLLGVWMVATDSLPRMGVAFLVAGILVASASTATIAIARIKVRELLGE